MFQFRALLASVAAHFVALGCSPLNDLPDGFGESTTIVVLVNPVINEGSTTDIEPGAQRGGIDVAIDGTSISDVTDDDGIAVLTSVPTGPNVLRFEEIEDTITVDVIRERELYDVVVSVTDDSVATIVDTVRYPISENVVVVAPGESIAEAASEDGTIVVLDEGEHVGDEEIRAEGVLIFGKRTAEEDISSIIDGDLTWLGGNGRMRGARVAGALTTSANGFSAAFCELSSANITGNAVSLIRNVFEGDATVPSSSAVLVDNAGIP